VGTEQHGKPFSPRTCPHEAKSNPLRTGCICCTVRGDLIRILTTLLTKKAGKFDHIVIETTGLADPAPVAQTFFVDDRYCP
jgi:G3E family GTPase